MENNVLVAYATKYGATKEIAKRIGEVLRQEGLNPGVMPANEARNLDQYQAVVLGSAVYAGQWRDEASTFLKENESKLALMPVWLFSSGPTGEGDPVELMSGWQFPETLKPIADRIQPQDIVFFHGKLDSKSLNFAEKLIVKGIKAPMGDFRDWEAITAWAEGIRESLNDVDTGT